MCACRKKTYTFNGRCGLTGLTVSKMFSISLKPMPGKRFLLFLFFAICQITAKASFVYDANCIEAYKAIISLRIPEAKLLIQKEKQLAPDNGIIVLLENYVDYFSLLASENKHDYDRLSDNKSKRLSALEENDKNSPFYLFSQAEVYLQWAFLKFKFGDYLSSALDAKKANNLLRENAEKYPDFIPDQKSLGLVNFIFGSVPASVKGIARFFGINGDVTTGLKQLEDVRVALPKSKYGFYYDEVVFFLCTIEIDGQHDNKAYSRLISYLDNMDKNSLLKAFLQGHIAAKTGHNDEAINYFEGCPRGIQFVSWPAMDYQLGNCKLNRLDNDAPVYLEKYINEFKGTNYIKDSYLKLGYYYLLQNNEEKYKSYITLVKTKGFGIDEKDKQALNEANDVKPDLDLLKSHLFFDGGYYEKAQAILEGKDVAKLTLLRDKIEYYYRLGRIYDKTNKTNEALLNYQRTINVGKTSRYYYAANAALNMGRICEEKHDFKKATEYYSETIDMKDHDMQASIDNEAKAGLKRVGG
jgi:Tetratricopeptide repeat